MNENVKKLGICVEVLGKIQVPVELTEQISVRIMAVRNTLADVMSHMGAEKTVESQAEHEEART